MSRIATNDNELIRRIIAVVLAQETAAAIPGTPLKQAFQPTTQGPDTEPTAYIHKIGDRRVGSPMARDDYDDEAEAMVHTQLQQMETTFQVSCNKTLDPSNGAAYTASDILNMVASILQSDATIADLESTEPYPIGILRITELRNPYFKDDRGQFSASPSFDFVLTHKQVILTTSPVIETTEFDIQRV